MEKPIIRKYRTVWPCTERCCYYAKISPLCGAGKRLPLLLWMEARLDWRLDCPPEDGHQPLYGAGLAAHCPAVAQPPGQQSPARIIIIIIVGQ